MFGLSRKIQREWTKAGSEGMLCYSLVIGNDGFKSKASQILRWYNSYK